MSDLTLTTISNGQTTDASTVMNNFNAIKTLIESLDKDNLSAAVQELLVPSGTVLSTGRSTAPAGYLMADGAAVSRGDYADLFAAIGTAYGAGDGVNTFNLPNLRGRVPVGQDAGTFATRGATGGNETVALTPAQSGLRDHTHSSSVPNHNHSFAVTSGNASGSSGTAASGTTWTVIFPQHTHSVSGLTDSGGGGSISSGNPQNTASTGATGGIDHNNLQPYQVVNHIIKI